MITEYYIVRRADWWIRLGFHGGTEDDHRTFLSSIGIEIEYLGQLPLPIKADIDVGCGLGKRKAGDAIVITCRHIKQMLTQERQSKPFIKQQRDSMKSIRKRQEEYLSKRY